jgi:ribosomal protein S8
MVLSGLAHLCSHLNNCTKARLSLAKVPNSKMHLRLALALQNSGLISTVIRAGETPPAPHLLLGQPSANDEQGSVGPVTQENVASQRLWLGLKYWQNEPVLGKMTLISKPKKRVSLDVEGLRRIVHGKQSGGVRGLRSPGECIFLATDRGVMEARECVEKKIGGMALCRVE